MEHIQKQPTANQSTDEGVYDEESQQESKPKAIAKKQSFSELIAAVAKQPRAAGTKAPKEALNAVYSAGVYKAGLTLNVLFLQSFMAGLYIAMAGQLLISPERGWEPSLG